ncbi:MAG: tetratricopeptide repeat-containing sulfotransferase family protein [Parvularcula sp.]
MTSDKSAILEDALAAEERGDVPKAKQLLSGLIEDDPTDFAPLIVLGGLLLGEGQPKSALPVLEKAVKLAPGHAGGWMNLSLAHLQNTNTEAAVSSIERALQFAPDSIAVLETAALVYEQAGDHRAAAKNLEPLVRHRVATPQQWEKCLLLYVHLGAPEYALGLFHQYPPKEAAPDIVTNVQFELLAAQKDWGNAARLAEEWLRTSPGNRAREALARALFEQGDIERASEIFAPLVQDTKTPTPEQALIFARISLHTHNYKNAERFIGLAAEKMPDNPDVKVARARLLTFQGNFDEAKSICEDVIAQYPDHILAYNQLNFVTRGKGLDRHQTTIDALANHPDTDRNHKAALLFALGDIAYRKNDPDRALSSYQAANLIRRDLAAELGHRHDTGRDERTFSTLREIADHLSTVEFCGHPSLSPLFVVGMPRSGTTLVERIIGRSANVRVGGELSGGPQIAHLMLAKAQKNGVTSITPDDLQQWSTEYLDRCPASASDNTLFTDKMPGNAATMFLLAKLFPRAKFVYCLRKAFDTATSIYRHQFPFGYTWAHQLEDIASYAPLYAKWAAQQAGALGERFTLLDYDRLVDAPEEGAAALLAALDLPDSTTQPTEQEEGPVATFSAVQARMPISKKASDSGHIFRDLMPDLADGLDASVYQAWSNMKRVP